MPVISAFKEGSEHAIRFWSAAGQGGIVHLLEVNAFVRPTSLQPGNAYQYSPVVSSFCYRANPIASYDITLGAFQLNNPSPDIVVRTVEKVIKHKDFNDQEEGSKGDIALVKLNTPVTYTRTIRPVCLPASSVSFPSGMKCTVTGWGNVLPSGKEGTFHLGTIIPEFDSMIHLPDLE